MDKKNIKNFLENNKPLINEFENLALKFALENHDKDLQHSLRNLLMQISVEAGRHQLENLDAVCEVFGQVFEEIENNNLKLTPESADIISSGMEMIYSTLNDEEKFDNLNLVLTEIEDSLTTILSGESIEIPPALLDEDLGIEKTSKEFQKYLEESEKQLSSIDDNLSTIDDNTDEKLESLHIDFHNFKGNSLYLGYDDVANIAQIVEIVLEAIVKNKIDVDDEIKDVLKSTYLAIRKSIDCIREKGDDEIDNSEILITLRELLNSISLKEKAHEVKEKADVSTELEIDYLDEFFVEAIDHITDIETKLLKIEEKADPDIISSMLNSFHSIKGSAQYIGLAKIGQLSHKAETILDNIRKENIKVNSDVIEVLLKTVDYIRGLMTEVEKEKKEIRDISIIEEWLDKISSGEIAESTLLTEKEKIHAGDFDKAPKDVKEEFVPEDTEASRGDEFDTENLNLLRNEFNNTYKKLLETIDNLKNNPGDAYKERTVLNLVHSVKGSAAYIPSPTIIKICEKLELLLQTAFDRQIKLNGKLYDLLIKSINGLKSIVESDDKKAFTEDRKEILEPINNTISDIISSLPDPLKADEHIDFKHIFNDNKLRKFLKSATIEKTHVEELRSIPDEGAIIEDLPSEEEIEKFDTDMKQDRSFKDKILTVKGFGKKFLDNLIEAGFDSDERLHGASIDALLEIKGMNLKKAQKIKELFPKEDLKPPSTTPPPSELGVGSDKEIEPPADKHVMEEPKDIDKHEEEEIQPILDNDYDRELVKIYHDTAKEYLSYCTHTLSDISDMDKVSEENINRLKAHMHNLYSSSNYMEYDKICSKINDILLYIDQFAASTDQDTNLFIRQVGKQLDVISKFLPTVDIEEAGVKLDEPTVINSDIDSEEFEDEELITIFVNAAENNIKELKNIESLIESNQADPKSISNLYSNLNNLQLSANFLGFENLFDIIDDAKNIANQLHDEEDRLDLYRFRKMQEYIDHIEKEVESIKLGKVIEIEPFREEAPSVKDEKKEEPVKKEAKPIITEPAEPDEKIKEEKPVEEPSEITITQQMEETLPEISFDFDELSPRTLRVDIQRVNELLNMTSELVINRSTFTQINSDYQKFFDYLQDNKKLSREEVQTLRSLISTLEQNVMSLERTANQLQDGVMKIRLVPLNLLLRKVPRIVRDLSRKTRKKVRVLFTGEETELDKTVIEKLNDPLLHIIRNAVDHGIENPEERKKFGKPPVGTINCTSYYEGDMVVIEVNDDGKGIDIDNLRRKVVEKKILDKGEVEKLSDSDLLEVIFLPGFSTSEQVTATSGRGVGMDVVRENIERLGGSVLLKSEKNVGTTVTLRIPLTLAIIKALLSIIDGLIYALPVASIVETLKIKKDTINKVDEEEVLNIHDKVIPLLRLSKIFRFSKSEQFKPPEDSLMSFDESMLGVESKEDRLGALGRRSSLGEDEIFVIIMRVGEKQVGLYVDALIGEQDIVIENLEDKLVRSQGVSGTAVLGDGSIALILDINELLRLSVEKERTKAKIARHSFLEKSEQPPEGADRV